jgi:putative hydrolase of HD superfamily
MDYDPEALLDFFKSAGQLKHLKRTGWINSGIDNPESVADHSFRTTLMAIILSDIDGLDTLRVARMAIIHDLAEGRIGDLTPIQKEAAGEVHTKAESTEIERLLSKLPEKMRILYSEAWNEFSNGLSEEAKLVKDADKLEMLLQSKEYEHVVDDRMKLMRFMHAEVKGLKAQEIVKILKKN